VRARTTPRLQIQSSNHHLTVTGGQVPSPPSARSRPCYREPMSSHSSSESSLLRSTRISSWPSRLLTP
jgi:hypothetical protein